MLPSSSLMSSSVRTVLISFKLALRIPFTIPVDGQNTGEPLAPVARQN